MDFVAVNRLSLQRRQPTRAAQEARFYLMGGLAPLKHGVHWQQPETGYVRLGRLYAVWIMDTLA